MLFVRDILRYRYLFKFSTFRWPLPVLPISCDWAPMSIFGTSHDRMIEQKRGVTVTDVGNPEVKIMASVSNGLGPEAPQTANGAVPSAKASSSSWDEDWGPVSKRTASSAPPLETSQSATTVRPPTPSVPLPSQPATSSCAPVDIEWPPPSSSMGFGSQTGRNSNQNQSTEGISVGNFDDIDPFADWPPRPGNAGAGATTAAVAAKPPQTNGSSVLNTASLSFFSSSTPMDLQRPHQAYSISSTNSPSLNGFPSRPIGGASGERKDIGSIFSSSSSDQATPRIAPPPVTAIGRGRGRSQGRLVPPPASRPGQPNARSEQPPLMDLLWMASPRCGTEGGSSPGAACARPLLGLYSCRNQDPHPSLP